MYIEHSVLDTKKHLYWWSHLSTGQTTNPHCSTDYTSWLCFQIVLFYCSHNPRKVTGWIFATQHSPIKSSCAKNI